MDVAAAGAANQITYEERAAELVGKSPQLSQLVTMFSAAQPSTNVDGAKILDFDAADEVLDSRGVAIFRADGDVKAGLKAFAGDQERGEESWLVRRESFEDLWDGGRKFIYGAVNPGHQGTGGRYGPFCLVIRPERVAGSHSAVFPGNTAELYGRYSGAADAAAAYAQAGCWSFVASIGVAVFGEVVADKPVDRWPQLICGEQRFLEVVTVAPIAFSDVLEVRITKELLRKFNAWSTLARRGNLPTPQQNALAAWRTVKKWTDVTRPHIARTIV